MRMLKYALSLLLVLAIFATPTLAQGTTFRPFVGQSCNPSTDVDYVHPSDPYLNLYCKKPSYYPAFWNYYHYGYDWDAAYGDNTKYQTPYNSDIDNDGTDAWSDLDDDGDGYNDYVEWEVCVASGTGCTNPSTSPLNNAALYEPFAVIASPTDGSNFPVSTLITFNATGSMGSNSGVLGYTWDFDYDGNTFAVDSSGTNPITSHTYTTSGVRTVGLRVSDGGRYSTIETIQVTIGTANTPPTILSQQTYSDSTIQHEFTVLAQASDAENNLDTCTLYHRLQGQTTWTSEQGSLNTNTGMCNGSVDNVTDGYNVGDTIETYITFADTIGATVNTSTDSHDVPNQGPTMTEVTIQGNNQSEGNDSWNTFGITITGLDDPEGDNIQPTSSFTYQWYEGTLGSGQAISGATSNTIDNNYFNKTDEIYVEVTPVDEYGTAGAAVTSTNSIVIQNAISRGGAVSLDNTTPNNSATVTASIDTLPNDPDMDTFTYSYTWVEMTPPPTSTVVQTLPPTTNSIDLSQYPLTEGNYLRVEITPNDGDDDGAMFSTDTSTDAVIQNTAPTIAAQQTYTDALTLHEFDVSATAGDADGVTDLASCTVYHRLQGQTTYTSAAGNLNSGVCSYTINIGSGYSVGDIVETYIQFADESATVDTTVDSHAIPNRAPQIQANGVTLAENTPGILTATVTATDAESDQILYDYVWSLGGNPLPGGAIQDSTSNVNDFNWVLAGVTGGQIVRVDVGVEDAYDVGNTDNDSYQVANNPPTGGVVGLSHTQATVIENPVTATITTPATDPEGTNIDYEYAWVFDADANWSTTGDQNNFVTNGPTASTTDAIDFGAYPAINKSGEVNVFVTAIDGGGLGGMPFSATPDISIINSAPTAVSMLGTPSSNSHAIDFQGVAADADGTADLTSCTLNHRLVGQTTYETKAGTLTVDTCTATINLTDTYSGTNYTVGDNVEAYFTFEDSDTATVDTSGSGSIQIPNQAPSATQLSIVPSFTATESDTLSISVETYSDPDAGDIVTPTYQWYEQTAGAITGATSNTLTNAYFNKGDQIYLEATPVDQYSGTGAPIQSNTITIVNSPPTLASASITPTPADTNDDLTCAGIGASDNDPGDTVTLSYLWSDDGGQTWQGSTPDPHIVRAADTTRGDSWMCRVTPNDGTVDGSPQTASVTVGNSAPTVPGITLTASPTEFDDLVCNITTASTDPDAGDSVQYNYTWYQNSAVYSTTGLTTSVSETILASVTSVGDTWICEVYATDGNDDSTPASETRFISAGSSNFDPVINLGYPLGGETLSGTVTLTAGVVDGDGTLNNYPVEFYYQKAGESTWTLIGSNNTFTGSLTTGAVFNYSWDTTTVDRGIDVTIRANVTDGFATDEATSGSVFVDNRRIFIDGSTIDSTQYNSYTSAVFVTLGNSTFDVDTDVLITTVTTSDVDNSYVNDSTLDTSMITDSYLDNSQITNCTVTNSTILDSTVQDSTITDAYINPSTIINSTISGDSDVQNSTVTDSTIDNQSVVHDSTVESSDLDSTTVDNTSVVRNSQLTGVNATSGSTVDNSVLSGTVELDGSSVSNTTLSGTYIFTNATVVDGIITTGTISDGTTTYDADLNGPTDVGDLFLPPPPVVMPLSIEDIDLDGKVSPGDELVVEIDILNDYTEDIDRVKVRAEIESKSFDASDTDRISIDSGDSEKVEFVFEVPEDAEDDGYDLEVTVEATLDDGTEVRVESSESFLVEREDHAFWIKRVEVEDLAKCGSDVEISVVVKNVGNDDEDDVRVAILNSQLPVLVNSDPFDLEVDDKRIKHIVFEVPENRADGAYQLVVKIYNDEASSYETVDLVVSDCGPSRGVTAANAGDLAAVQPMLEVPQDTMVRAVLTLTNTGSDVTDYTFDLAGVASWAQTWNLEPRVVRLMPGDSVAMYLTAVPKQGYTGNQPAIIYLKGPNGLLLDTEVLNVHLVADATVIASGQTTDTQTGVTTITGTTTSGGGFSGLVRRLLWILS